MGLSNDGGIVQTVTDTTSAARHGATVGVPSAEIEGMMAKFYQAASQGNFEVMDDLLSRRAGALWIGTDARERWETPEAVSQAWRAQTAELGGPARITGGNTTAFQQGEVAWVADDPVFHLPDGTTLPFRLTAVWVHEPDGWRVVQVHTSFGVANESVLQPR